MKQEKVDGYGRICLESGQPNDTYPCYAPFVTPVHREIICQLVMRI